MVAKLQSAFDSPDNSPNYLLMIELFLERREHIDSGMYILDNSDMSHLAALIYTASTSGATNDEIMTSLDYMLKRTGVKRANVYPTHLISTLRLHDRGINNVVNPHFRVHVKSESFRYRVMWIKALSRMRKSLYPYGQAVRAVYIQGWSAA